MSMRPSLPAEASWGATADLSSSPARKTWGSLERSMRWLRSAAQVRYC